MMMMSPDGVAGQGYFGNVGFKEILYIVAALVVTGRIITVLPLS